MKLSGLFSNGMVLQRGKANTIYGIADSGTMISVIIHEQGKCLYKEEYGPEFPADDVYGVSVLADENGYFEVTIPAREQAGPYEILVNGNNEHITISDVLMGDVFLLGGQSNMELTVGMIPDENDKVIIRANNDKIRMVNIPHEYDFSGKRRMLDTLEWVGANQNTISNFSAIGYFFAENKYKEDGVPVGLIHTAVGGAPIEALMSEENIRKKAELIRTRIDTNGDCNHGKMDGGSPVVSNISNDCQGGTFVYNLEHDKHRGCIYCYDELFKRNSQPGYADSVVEEDLKRVAAWHEDVDGRDTGLNQKWYLSNWKDDAAGSEFENICDLSNVIDNDESVLKTRTFKAPAFFNNTLYEDYFGTLWLQKEFYLSEKHAKYGAKLYLGTLVDFDDTYVNGVKVGHTDYRYPQRRYGIKEGTLKPGKNTVTVRLGMDGNVGGFLPDMPYKIVIEADICKSRSMCTGGNCSSCCNTNCNGDACSNGNIKDIIEIPLSGEWLIREGAKAKKLDGETFFIWQPSALYNSMIAPLKGLAVSAILFYQGESNGFAPEYYDILFDGMIEEWRTIVGDVPILYSELAVYLGDGPEYKEDSFEGVRLVQQKVEKELKDAYLIPITKLQAPYNELHPQNKKEVADMFYDAYKILLEG